MEKTLVIIKPGTIQRGLTGRIISRLEEKGLKLVGIKMMQLTDELLNEHYAHLKEKSFFTRVKGSMERSPVIVTCWEGIDAVPVVRALTGSTNGRTAQPGTIRGDFSMSVQENVVHTSDSAEAAEIEVKRFFEAHELFMYDLSLMSNLYASDEI